MRGELVKLAHPKRRYEEVGDVTRGDHSNGYRCIVSSREAPRYTTQTVLVSPGTEPGRAVPMAPRVDVHPPVNDRVTNLLDRIPFDWRGPSLPFPVSELWYPGTGWRDRIRLGWDHERKRYVMPWLANSDIDDLLKFFVGTEGDAVVLKSCHWLDRWPCWVYKKAMAADPRVSMAVCADDVEDALAYRYPDDPGVMRNFRELKRFMRAMSAEHARLITENTRDSAEPRRSTAVVAVIPFQHAPNGAGHFELFCISLTEEKGIRLYHLDSKARTMGPRQAESVRRYAEVLLWTFKVFWNVRSDLEVEDVLVQLPKECVQAGGECGAFVCVYALCIAAGFTPEEAASQVKACHMPPFYAKLYTFMEATTRFLDVYRSLPTRPPHVPNSRSQFWDIGCARGDRALDPSLGDLCGGNLPPPPPKLEGKTPAPILAPHGQETSAPRAPLGIKKTEKKTGRGPVQSKLSLILYPPTPLSPTVRDPTAPPVP